MKEEQLKNKHSNIVAIEILISVFVVVIICVMVIDFSRPITYGEVSKAGMKSLESASEEALGQRTKVTAKYLDVEGNELAPSEELEGIVGEEYELPGKKISGYKLVGDEPYAKTGNFQNRDVEVEFVYKESNEHVDIAEGNNNDVLVRMKSQKLISEYNLKIITKDEDGYLVKGVSYEVTKNDDVMRDGMVQGNTFVVGTVTINKEGEDICKITENPGNYYETLVDGDIQFSINKVWNYEEGVYEVSVSYDKSMKGVEVKIEGTDIIVTITNKAKIIEEKGGDPTPKPDSDSEPELEPEPQKVFDLAITKYISKVVVDNGEATKEINRTIDNKNSLLKLEIAAKEIPNTTVTITYNLLVKNVGEVAGYATEITDYLPDNFTLVDTEEWMDAEKAVITNALADKLLKPGESVEIPVTFNWKLDENNTGLRKNQAQITICSNEENLADITPDNIDDAQIIVTIKTGIVRTIGFGALVTLIVLAGVIYKEKERIKNGR